MSSAPSVNVCSVLILKSDRLYAEMLRQFTFRVFPRARVRLVATIHAADEALATEPVDLFVTGVGSALEGDVLDLLARGETLPAWFKRVLIVTARREYRLLAALRALNVDGVFDSVGEAPEQLMTALRTVAAGARYWSASLLDEMQRASSAAATLERVLTVFEQVVLSVIGDGCDDAVAARELGLSPATVSTVRRDAVAARELGLSPATVSTVRRELHRKLRVQHRGELVRIAAQHGFVRFTPTGVVRPGYALLSATYQARRSKRAAVRPARAQPQALPASEIVAEPTTLLAMAS